MPLTSSYNHKTRLSGFLFYSSLTLPLLDVVFRSIFLLFSYSLYSMFCSKQLVLFFVIYHSHSSYSLSILKGTILKKKNVLLSFLLIFQSLLWDGWFYGLKELEFVEIYGLNSALSAMIVSQEPTSQYLQKCCWHYHPQISQDIAVVGLFLAKESKPTHM